MFLHVFISFYMFYIGVYRLHFAPSPERARKSKRLRKRQAKLEAKEAGKATGKIETQEPRKPGTQETRKQLRKHIRITCKTAVSRF